MICQQTSLAIFSLKREIVWFISHISNFYELELNNQINSNISYVYHNNFIILNNLDQLQNFAREKDTFKDSSFDSKSKFIV